MRIQLVDQLEAGLARHAFNTFHAPRIQVQRGAAAFGVADHQRLQGLRHCGALFGAERGHLARALAAFVDMRRPELHEVAPPGFGQVVERRPRIDKLGVAPGRRKCYRVQHGGFRRGRKVGMVGVEVLAPNMQLAVDQRQVAARDRADLGVLGQGEFLELLLEQVAEDPRCGGELGWFELLVADHEDCVLDPGVVQRALCIGGERLRQIDAGHFGAEPVAQRVDFHAHGGRTFLTTGLHRTHSFELRASVPITFLLSAIRSGDGCEALEHHQLK